MLVRPADIYLLDEPLSHLDAKLRAAMRAELKQLGAISNTTTLYVTHDYQEALALGDRIAVLREGRLVQVGTPQEIWRRPADTFVARALGQPEINLLDGVVDDGRIASATAHSTSRSRELDCTSGDRLRLGLRPREIHVVGADKRVGDARSRGPAQSAWVAMSSSRRGRQCPADRGRLRRERVEEGAHIAMTVADSDIHVFDYRRG